MKNRLNTLLIIAGLLGLGTKGMAQVQCDPNYSIYNLRIVNGAVFGANSGNKVQMNALGPMAGDTPQYQSDNSFASGFWGFYQTEPFSPLVDASDGDYQDRIEVNWQLIDDNLASPISGSLTKIYRNGSLLTTVPVTQTTYQDFNVFPGEFYNYEIVVENDLGASYREGDVGFLNPNGLVLGSVKTMNQVPVADVEVRLTPNLGLALEFNGQSDFVVFDSLTTLPLDSAYTIEGWFRAYPDFNEQVLFAATAVGKNAHDPYIRIELNSDGKLAYTHRSAAGAAMPDSIVTPMAVNDLTWHHFAAVHDSSNMTLYLDGDPINTIEGSVLGSGDMNLVFGKKSPLDDEDYFHGRLDDFRFWNVARSQAEVRLNDQHTLNGEEPGIYAYWKFDEVLGTKIFDLTDDNVDGFICGLDHTELHAPVYVSGITNEQGEYSIKGIYYGAGTTFNVTPGKETPIGNALNLDGVDDYISFPYQRIDLTTGYTLEGWFKTAAAVDQTLLAATDPADGSDHVVISLLADGTLQYIQNGTVLTSSNTYNDEFWHHFAVTYDGSDMILYGDGDVEASQSGVEPVPVESEFVFGRRSVDTAENYVTGKIDEFRLWDSVRNEAQIDGTMNQVLNGDENGLTGYWKFNEGFGSVITDNTSSGFNGNLMNATDETWVEDIPLDEYFAHYFDIESRQATLNPSNTSVDRVDFTDLSTVSATGFVQFQGSACFEEGVELLVDGESTYPPVITDASGRFLAEFEPGRDGAILTPTLEGHEFTPSYIELPKMNAPLAGLVFTDTKKNDLTGKVAGGLCEFPITPSQGEIQVHIASISGCIDTTVVPDPSTGDFVCENLPPLIYNVTVDHPDPEVDQYFTGDTVSLKEGDANVDFIYRSAPHVTISGFDTNACGMRVINELEVYTLHMDIFESYNNAGVINTCPVDSGQLTISDFIGDANDTTVVFTNGSFDWTHQAGYPNILGGGDHPYQKNIQVVAEAAETGQSTTDTEWSVVLGNRPRNAVFTTNTPELPIMILRDPPGDNSYSYYTTENSTSYSTSFQSVTNATAGVSGTVHMGSQWIISAGAWGVPDIKIDLQMDLTTSMSVSSTQSNYYEQNWTFSTTENFNTSDDPAVVGDGGDLFVGGAMNMNYGITDILQINDSCQAEVVQDIIVSPSGFATNYIYSEAHIVGTLIPSLYTTGDTTSAEMWEQIIQRNNELKDAASFQRNVSFDGAAGGYDYSETTETSETMSVDFELQIDAGVALTVGAEINDFGAEGTVSTNMSYTMGQSETTTNTHTNTFGYVLDDDDPGDYFSVNVSTDNVYGSPVFGLVSGASSCPWEPNTAPREGVSLAIDHNQEINVPPDDPAVFTLILGNTSQTDEDGTFDLQILQDTNPDGANISINGVNFEDTYPIFLLAGQQTEVTMTVDRGPNVYEYNDIGIRLQSGCEYELWGDRGDATAPIPISDSVFFSIEYDQPCSEVAIAVPEDNWLVTGEDASDSLWVTLSGYDLTDPNFDHLELQYRANTAVGNSPSGDDAITGAGLHNDEIRPVNLERSFDGSLEGGPQGQQIRLIANTSGSEPKSPGSGTGKNINSKSGATSLVAAGSGNALSDNGSRTNDWFVAQSIPKDSLVDDFILVPWNINADIIPDGPYELRAVAQCDAGLYPGTSQILSGIIDRTAPQVVGLPTPVDGVLGPNDLISVTLDEDIDCEAINVGAGDIQLTNTVTGNPVDFTYTCGGNQIFIEPNVQNTFIENQILRVDIANVTDTYGNQRTEPIEWEFFVNRNPIEWSGGDISDVVIYDDQSFIQTRTLVNHGGSPRSFDMTNVPSWLEVSPMSGTIAPGNAVTVTISIPDDISSGIYNQTIYASGTMGDEPMLVDVRILCHEPLWQVSPSEYQYSMNMIGYLSIDDTQSDDDYDQVSAFVDDQCRGVANVQYMPDLDAYEVFLTVYSNQAQGEPLSFKVWDASGCVNYGFILEEYNFEANAVLGTLSDPVTFTATNQLIQQRQLPIGWTWFSLNLETDNMSTNTLLNTLSPISGDLVKSQVSFDQFVPGVGWVGGLDTLRNTSMYQIKLTHQDSLDLVGFPVNAELTPIDVAQGWNWVSYLPQSSIEVNQALVSLEAITGDLIKSQFGFAQYLENVGWLGSLTYMNPHLGYLLYSTNGGELTYPVELPNTSPAGGDSLQNNVPDENAPDWIVNAQSYEYNMTLTGVLQMDGSPVTGSGNILGAFMDETGPDGPVEVCRGVAQSVYVSATDQTFFFLMIYSNLEEGETIHFKYYDSQAQQVYPVAETYDFASNAALGDPQTPEVLTNAVLGVGNEGYVPDVYSLSQNFPNPFNPTTRFGFGLPEAGKVTITIYDLLGRPVRTLVSEQRDAGYYFVQWDSRDDRGVYVASGLYITVMQSGSFRDVKKIILLK